MDKTTLDYIKTQRLTDQINLLVLHSFVLLWSVIIVSWLFIEVVSNTTSHATSGVAMIIGILIVGNALSLRDKVIIV